MYPSAATSVARKICIGLYKSPFQTNWRPDDDNSRGSAPRPSACGWWSHPATRDRSVGNLRCVRRQRSALYALSPLLSTVYCLLSALCAKLPSTSAANHLVAIARLPAGRPNKRRSARDIQPKREPDKRKRKRNRARQTDDGWKPDELAGALK